MYVGPLPFPLTCFYPALHFVLQTVGDLREMEGECPRRYWPQFVTQSHIPTGPNCSPEGIVVTHILTIDCVEAA